VPALEREQKECRLRKEENLEGLAATEQLAQGGMPAWFVRVLQTLFTTGVGIDLAPQGPSGYHRISRCLRQIYAFGELSPATS